MARRTHSLLGLLLFVVVPACAATGALEEDGDLGARASALGGGVVVNEFKAGTSGWIELYNAGASTADLTGWQVDDVASGGGLPKSVGSGVVLAPGGRVVVPYTAINVSTLDSVRLLDATGAEVDAHSNYFTGSSTTGKCYGRRPDGGPWAATDIPCTQGATNGGNGNALLRGVVVGPTSFYTGEVLVSGGNIVCAATSCASDPAAAGATIVETNGIVFPGMIDTHNHILFDTFDETDWSPTKLYANHDQWPNDARYSAMVDAKQYLNGEAGSPVNVGCELDKYGELKGLIAGTTSISGAANPANKSCYGTLARTIDQSSNGLGEDKIQVATIFPSTSSADGVCNNLASSATNAYSIHVGEGVDAHSLAEFAKLGTISTIDQCLYAPQTTIVHGTAFGDAEMTTMAAHGMSLVWSPRSNVFLYGGGTDYTKTTNVPLALSKGINVALAPDWSIGGSQNLLDELRFARTVDAAAFGNVLTPRMLVDMVTINAARALHLDAQLGSIEPGKKADLMVIRGDLAAPYESLLAAHPSDVALVMVGGVALYGDVALQPLAPTNPGCEPLNVCGASKFVCVATTGGTTTNLWGETLADITSTISSALQAYDDQNLTAWDFSPIAPLVKCP